MELSQLYEPIKKELVLVEKLIENTLLEVKDSNLKMMNSLILQSKGKRLRPAFVLLFAYAADWKNAKMNEQKEALIKTAAAFELIHMATLVHDDVMDENTTRHGKPTINKTNGNPAAIGVGDFLFSKAFVLLSETNNAQIVGIASKAIADVCVGQIYQLSRRGLATLTMKEGKFIIEKKTAALFAAACESGALIAQGDAKKAKEFGHHFGIAFQLIDDYTDIVGTEKMLGKKPGENLHEGEATIPLLILLSKVSSQERKILISKMFLKNGISLVKTAMMKQDIKTDVGLNVQNELKLAIKGLDLTTPYAQSLLGISLLLEKRMSLL